MRKNDFYSSGFPCAYKLFPEHQNCLFTVVLMSYSHCIS